jgi:hypothetical protein
MSLLDAPGPRAAEAAEADAAALAKAGTAAAFKEWAQLNGLLGPGLRKPLRPPSDDLRMLTEAFVAGAVWQKLRSEGKKPNG